MQHIIYINCSLIYYYSFLFTSFIALFIFCTVLCLSTGETLYCFYVEHKNKEVCVNVSGQKITDWIFKKLTNERPTERSRTNRETVCAALHVSNHHQNVFHKSEQVTHQCEHYTLHPCVEKINNQDIQWLNVSVQLRCVLCFFDVNISYKLTCVNCSLTQTDSRWNWLWCVLPAAPLSAVRPVFLW